MQYFNHLINPINYEDFFQNYYEKKPLIIHRNQSDYYSNLLTLESIDKYVSRQDIEYPSLRLVKDGNEIEGTKYLKDIPYGTAMFEGIVDNDSMFQLFNEGATIVIQGLDRSNEQLGLLCRSLSKEIPFTFQSNTYLTPETSQGFAAHYDTHDVFVMQITGSKKWKLYDTPIELPTKQQRYQSIKRDFSKSTVSQEFELMAGDLLYIPRGLVHSAETGSTSSLHITLGIFPQKWNDYVRFLTTELFNQKIFRESLPLDLKNSTYDYKKMTDEVSSILLKALNNDYIEDITKRYETEQIQKRKSSDGSRLFDILNIKKVEKNTIVARRQDIVSRLTQNNGSIELLFYNKKITFPVIAQNTVENILSLTEFTIADIQSNLDDNGKLVVVKKLIKEGLLTIKQ
jgi:ribosomal protein L16 Arg81 hydroxylase